MIYRQFISRQKTATINTLNNDTVSILLEEPVLIQSNSSLRYCQRCHLFSVLITSAGNVYIIVSYDSLLRSRIILDRFHKIQWKVPNGPSKKPLVFRGNVVQEFWKTASAHFPSIHQFILQNKQINIKVHLQGEWKKRGDSLLSPLTHNILLYF